MGGVSPYALAWTRNTFPVVDSDRKTRLAYAIRKAREARGLTPPQLAVALGRSRGTINDWESGKSAPSLLDLGPLCEALGVDARLFAVLPSEPRSPVEDFLVTVAVEEGEAEGRRRAARRPAAPSTE